ncbi:MAG: hypothetical protein AB2827_14435 [Candidatus Thiodiazotropha sp.]
MAIKLQLSDQQTKDWDRIIELPLDGLDRLLQELLKLDKPGMRIKELRKRINTALGSEKDGTLLGRHLIRLATLNDDENVSPDIAIDAVSEALASIGWSDEKLDKLTKIRPILVSLLNTDSVCYVAKSLRLTYSQSNLLQDSKIVTDIRPVFSKDRTGIIGAIIIQTLSIDYIENGRHKTISFALDDGDLENIRDISTQSLNKAKLSKKLVTDNCDLTAYIAGEDSDGNS